MKSLLTQFKKPSRESSPWALWNWNASVTLDSLLEQCTWFHECGFCGVCIRPSREMVPSYLSHEFFELFTSVLEYASRVGMYVRLADDFSISWTDCFRNEQLENPKARAQALVLVEQRMISGGQELVIQNYHPDMTIIVAVKEHEGVIDPASATEISSKSSQKALRWQVPEGTWRMCTFNKEYIRDHTGSYVLNLFGQKNTSVYIQQVLEHFKSRYSKYIPSVFQGFINELPAVTPAKNGIPWDVDLVVKFRSKSKKNIIKLLPALFCDNYPGASKNRQQIYTFIHEITSERSIAPLEEWSKKNKMTQWILYPERSLYARSFELIDGYVPLSSDVSAVGFQAINGIGETDVLIRIMADLNTNECRRDTIAVIGRNRVGCGATLQLLKSDVDQVFISGASHIIIDGFFTNADQHNYGKIPISPGWFSPEKHLLKDLCRYITFTNEMLRNVHWNRQVAVLSPVSEIMASYLPSNGESSLIAAERLKKTLSALEQNGYSYDFVTEQLLGTCTIRTNGEFGTTDRIRKGNYQALIIPFAPELSRNVLIFIEKLVQKKGCVLFIDETPSGTIEDGISSTMTSRFEKILSDRHKTTGVTEAQSIDEVLATINPSIEFISQGKSGFEIASASGVKDTNDMYLLHNMSQQKDYSIVIEVEYQPHFALIDCERGALIPVEPVERIEEKARFQLVLAPKTMVMFIGSQTAVTSSGVCNTFYAYANPIRMTERNYRILVKNQWHFSPLSANNYPLTAWNIRIGLSRESGGFSHFYESHFPVKHVPTQCSLLVNIAGLARINDGDLPLEITVNGTKVDFLDGREIQSSLQKEEADQLDDSYVYALGSLFRLYKINEYLIRGTNRISLRTIESSGSPGIIMFPPWLCGNFILSKGQNGGAIDKLEDTVVPGSWVKNGYPCLCGKGVYRQSFELPNEYKKLVLSFPNVSGAIEVAMNGKELGVFRWQPMSVDITDACEQRRNELTVRVFNSIDTLLKMNGRPSGLIGDVYMDVY